jgi:hypothetical protein
MPIAFTAKTSEYRAGEAPWMRSKTKLEPLM